MAADPNLQRVSTQFTDAMPSLPSYMPRKPDASSGGSLVFPADLENQDRKFYIDIQFVEYSGAAAGLATLIGSGPGVSLSGGGIRLPLPRIINDHQTVTWEQNSYSSQVADFGSNLLGAVDNTGGKFGKMLGGAAESLGAIVGSMTQQVGGVSLNPFLYLLFKSPQLKTFNFEWYLVASTQGESDKIKNIVKEFKSKMLPTRYMGIGLKYPDVAKIKLSAGGTDDYLFKFKPCVLTSLSVNHTASGNPSFFKSGAATVINIAANFQEMEIWTREDIQ